MARRRKKTDRREDLDFTTELSVPVMSPREPLKTSLTAFEDLRRYSPVVPKAPQGFVREAIRPVMKYDPLPIAKRSVIRKRVTRSVRSPWTAKPSKATAVGFHSQKAAKLQYKLPNQVYVCVRRKTRQQVLFALKKAGRGGSQKRHRRTKWSEISC